MVHIGTPVASLITKRINHLSQQGLSSFISKMRAETVPLILWTASFAITSSLIFGIQRAVATYVTDQTAMIGGQLSLPYFTVIIFGILVVITGSVYILRRRKYSTFAIIIFELLSVGLPCAAGLNFLL